MRAGFSLDLTILNDQGLPWDFDKPEMRLKAKRLVMETKQKLRIGSPCGGHSQFYKAKIANECVSKTIRPCLSMDAVT